MGKRQRMAEIEQSELSEAEYVEIKKLLNTHGWSVFERLADEQYDVFYSKLRHVKKDDEFYRIQGRIQAIEMLLELPAKMIEIYNTKS